MIPVGRARNDCAYDEAMKVRLGGGQKIFKKKKESSRSFQRGSLIEE